jgi:hypothetical protein
MFLGKKAILKVLIYILQMLPEYDIVAVKSRTLADAYD